MAKIHLIPFIKNKYINGTFFLLLALLSACTPQLMNKSNFDQISIGMPVTEVCQLAGEPYRKIKNQPYIDYEYMERFEIGPRTTHQNTYIVTIKDGIVVDKQMKNETTPINFSIP